MKMIKKTFASILAILLVIGMMAGSVLPASAATVAGDVNEDGKVNLLDVAITLRLMAGYEYKGKANIRAMFVTGDSKANTADAVLMLRNAAGWTDAVLTAISDKITDNLIKEPNAACASYYYGPEINVFNQNIRHSSDTYYFDNGTPDDTSDDTVPYYSYTKTARIERFHTIMENYAPDVVGLQEYRSDDWYKAWEGTTGHTNRTAISTTGGAVAYTVETSEDSILGSGYSGYIQSRADPGKMSNKTAAEAYEEHKAAYEADPTSVNPLDYAYQPDERLALFWRASKFDLVANDVFWINNAGENGESVPFAPAPGRGVELASKDFNENGTIEENEYYWQNNENRLCLWVKLKDKDTDITFYYATVHLNANGDAEQGAQVVMDEMDLVMEKYGEAPIVISGDFNLPDTCTAYNNLCKKYNDVAAEMGCTDKTFSAYTKVWKGETAPSLSKRIDFVFTEDRGGTADSVFYKVVTDTADATVNGTLYPDDVPSDHYGLNCTILINN